MSWLRESKDYRNRVERTYRNKYSNRLTEDKSINISKNVGDEDYKKEIEEIEEFLSSNFNYLRYLNSNPRYIKKLYDKYIKDLNIEEYVEQGLLTKEEDGRYSCLSEESADRMDNSNFIRDGKFIIKFNKWVGDFDCSHYSMISLEGSPREVSGDFDCSYNSLTSLEGAPKKVGVDFNCSDNKLTSLEGAPKRVGRDFICKFNNFTTLDGDLEYVGNLFDCSSNRNIIDMWRPAGRFDSKNNPWSRRIHRLNKGS